MSSENNVIKLLKKIGQEFDSIETNAEKFVEGNNSAGTRVRKYMQQVKNIAQKIRVEVQEQKNSVAA